MRLQSMLLILVGLVISPGAVSQTFNDVPQDHWAFSFIEELADRGITAGCGGGNFCPEDTVTRAQMAVFLIRVITGQEHHGFVAVPGNAVRPSHSSSSVTSLADGSITAAQTGSTFNFGSVQLPDQKVILGMKCWLRDPEATGYIQILLLRHELGATGFAGDSIASTATSPATITSGFVEQSATANSNFAVVDNANFTYFLRVDFLDVTITTNGIAFRGCSIEMAT